MHRVFVVNTLQQRTCRHLQIVHLLLLLLLGQIGVRAVMLAQMIVNFGLGRVKVAFIRQKSDFSPFASLFGNGLITNSEFLICDTLSVGLAGPVKHKACCCRQGLRRPIVLQKSFLEVLLLFARRLGGHQGRLSANLLAANGLTLALRLRLAVMTRKF